MSAGPRETKFLTRHLKYVPEKYLSVKLQIKQELEQCQSLSNMGLIRYRSENNRDKMGAVVEKPVKVQHLLTACVTVQLADISWHVLDL